LVLGLHRKGRDVAVAVFYSGGPLERELTEGGVPLFRLEKKGRWDLPFFFRRLVDLVRMQNPAVIHSYMGANLFVVPLRIFFPRISIVWGLRESNIDTSQYDWWTKVFTYVVPKLSSCARLIVSNSSAGAAHAVLLGYPKSKIVVIPNGIDTGRFRPERDKGLSVRAAWNVAPDEILIARIGRLDPMKDYRTFLTAAAGAASRHSSLKFVCIGNGPPAARAELEEQVRTLGLQARVVFSVARLDMGAVYNAIDILVSSSAFGEGFPNVIAEALASGVPCVTTDVGDASLLVEDPELVVPARDPNALLQAWETCLRKLPVWDPHAARARIVERFSVERLVESTDRLILERT
jgi:glycosyltransferase involved in cell wall biosynthesis